MAVSDITYSTAELSLRKTAVQCADAASVVVATGDDVTPTSSSRTARQRVANALLQNAPVLVPGTAPKSAKERLEVVLNQLADTQDSMSEADLSAEIGVSVQTILSSAMTKADLPSALSDTANAVFQQLSAINTADNTELGQLGTAVAALMDQLPNTDLNNPFANYDPSNGKDPAAFMAFILFASILTAQNEGVNSKSTTDLSTSFVSVAKSIMEKAQSDLKAYTAQVESEKHSSFLSKIFTSIASALLIAIGGLSGQPELAIAGVLMMTMKLSGGQAKLEEQLDKLPLVGKIFAEVGIALLQAVVCCGASSAMTMGASGIKSMLTGAEEGAAAKAAAAAAGAGAGAGGAVAAGADAAALGATQTGFSVARKWALKTVQQLMNGSFWTDLMKGLMQAGGAGESRQDKIAGIVGPILGILSSLGASQLGAVGDVSYDLSKSMGEEAFGNFKKLLDVTRSSMAITAAGFNISAAKTMMTEATILRDQATDQSFLTLVNYVGDTARSASLSTQQTAKASNESFTAIFERFDEIFVTPWQIN